MASKKKLSPLAPAVALGICLYVGWLVGWSTLVDRLNAFQAAPSALTYVQALMWPLAAGVLAAAGTNWALRFAIRQTLAPTGTVDADD